MIRRCLPLAIVLLTAVPAGAIALVAGASIAEASLFREATLELLTQRSSLVIEGTPVEARTLWEETPTSGRRIVTYTRVVPSRTVLGTASGDVWVRTLGGRVDKVGQIVEGEASLGLNRKALLFLRPGVAGVMSVTEMGQGHYLLQPDDKGVHRLRSLFPAHLVQPSPDVTGARQVLEGKSIDDAAKAIVAARGARP
jgi:hypothetical protein